MCRWDLLKRRQGLLSVPKLAVGGQSVKRSFREYSFGYLCASSNCPISHYISHHGRQRQYRKAVRQDPGRDERATRNFLPLHIMWIRSTYGPEYNTNTAEYDAARTSQT